MAINFTRMKVRITFTEEALGTASSNETIYSDFIGSKAPDAASLAEEVAALGAEEITEKGTTVFPRTEDGQPMFWDYQIKGMLKGTGAFLYKVPGSEVSKIKAYKKNIDGLIFVYPRQIPIHLPDGAEIGICERPLRAQTAQGDRVALARSETVPAGSWFECEIEVAQDSLWPFVRECLDYGERTGIGQWRNSGKGRFRWEEIE